MMEDKAFSDLNLKCFLKIECGFKWQMGNTKISSKHLAFSILCCIICIDQCLMHFYVLHPIGSTFTRSKTLFFIILKDNIILPAFSK